MTLRAGPDTSTPPPLAAWAHESIPETAEGFARAVQALLIDRELIKDLDVRDEQIACLAFDYAAQFLPSGIVYPDGTSVVFPRALSGVTGGIITTTHNRPQF